MTEPTKQIEPERTETVTPIRMKPIIILPVGEMCKEDMQLLRDNGICVVESEDPDNVRFLEPPPADYSACEQAAIKLFRVMHDQRGPWAYSDITRTYVDILVRGSEPKPVRKVASVKKAAKS